MAIFIGLIWTILILILQTAVVSQIPLLSGTADLALLGVVCWGMNENVKDGWQWSLLAAAGVSLISAAPVGAVLAAYLLISAVIAGLRRRIWQAPLLGLFTAALLATAIFHLATIGALALRSAPISLGEAFNQVTLPSILLNLLLALPMYGLVNEIALWVYPPEEE